MYQVLIVDDEEIVCRGMAQFVKWEKCGFEVAGIAASVDEALRMLKKMSIDVVFTDIRMPEKSGIDLLKEVQELYPDVKTVVLSGYSDFDYAKDAIRYGAVEYLTKPVNLGEVEELLGRLSEKSGTPSKRKPKFIHITWKACFYPLQEAMQKPIWRSMIFPNWRCGTEFLYL